MLSRISRNEEILANATAKACGACKAACFRRSFESSFVIAWDRRKHGTHLECAYSTWLSIALAPRP